jgi:hypothetical protein
MEFTMQIHGISRDLIDLLRSVGADRHPLEFVGVLREEDGIIHELNLLPGTISGEHSASLFVDMMPLDLHVVGSAHSHPNGVIRPSNADLLFFPRVGRFHFIIGYPYGGNDWGCFRADGTRVDMEVIG